jgi:hypothetical protein
MFVVVVGTGVMHITIESYEPKLAYTTIGF